MDGPEVEEQMILGYWMSRIVLGKVVLQGLAVRQGSGRKP